MLDRQRRIKVLGKVRDKWGDDPTFEVSLEFRPVGKDRASAELKSGPISAKREPRSGWENRYEFSSYDGNVTAVAGTWPIVLGIQFLTDRCAVFPD